MVQHVHVHFIICWLPHSLRVPIRKLHRQVLPGHPATSDRHIRSIRSPPPRFIVTKQSLCLEGRQEIAPGTVYSSDVGWPSYSLTLLHYHQKKISWNLRKWIFTKIFRCSPRNHWISKNFTAFLSFSNAFPLRYRNASARQEKNGWILRQQLCVLPGPAGDCQEPL